MPKPDGYPAVSPYLVVPDADATLEFVKRALGGVVLDRITDGDRVAHAAVRIDDSVVMLGEMGDSPSSSHVHVYVEDVDATYQACLDAGAESVQEPVQKDDPDRRGGVKGPGGVTWWVSTHVGL